MPRSLVLPVVLALLLCAPAAASAADPVLTAPESRLAESLTCRGSLAEATRPPVLLVHGTGSNPRESWRSGYLHALALEGFTVCAVELPGRALGDIQVSSEHVVHAVRRMAARSGRRVSIIGHSQGGLEPLWALRFWPSLRDDVEDSIALATPFNGSQGGNDRCRTPCQPAVWQQRRGSRFLAALHAGGLPPGPSYTSVLTRFDQVVYPQPEASTLAGARTIAVQDVCPGRPVDHLNIIYDDVVFQLVLDALRNPGAADPARLPATVCGRGQIPVDQRTYGTDVSAALVNLLAAFATHPTVPEEPALFCYADSRSSRGAGTTCPRAARERPRLRLAVTPGTVRAGRVVHLRFRATASGRPVGGATVRIGGRAARTDDRGRAVVRIAFARRGVRLARVMRAGHRAASAQVRVREAAALGFTGRV